MRITYRHSFVAWCPVDGSPDVYELEIVANRLIQVEDILAAVRDATGEPAFQEAITSRISRDLGPTLAIKTTGIHSGVETVVEC